MTTITTDVPRREYAASGDDALTETIAEYWDERAQSYSNGVIGELGDGRHDAWRAAIMEAVGDMLDRAGGEGRAPRAADLGCGPGFFSVLLADMGFAVDAVDASDAMLDRARQNVQAAASGAVAFHKCDLLGLPLDDESLDVCISRNVTWLMRDPRAAYAEWLRVLRPGGKLVVFDANWYRYLVDPVLDAQRLIDQERNELEWADDARATTDEERRCELIAAELPLTSVMRPAWDLETLAGLGVSNARADEDAWLRLWTESEQAYYRTSPLFMVEAVK